MVLFKSAPGGVAPFPGTRRCWRPRDPAISSSAIMCRPFGRIPSFLHRLNVLGVRPEAAAQLGPREARGLPEAVQPLREVVEMVVGVSGVMRALSRHVDQSGVDG